MITRAVVLASILIASAGVIGHASRSEPVPIRASFDTFPPTLGQWRGARSEPLDPAVLAVLGVNDYIVRDYFAPRRIAGLYVGYWQTQREGDTIHSPLNCLPGSGWQPVSKSTLGVGVSDPTVAGGARDVGINRYVIQKGLDQMLVLYWYQSHGRVVASEYTGKFYLVADALRLNRTDAAIVRVTVPIATGIEDGSAVAERDGVDFVKTLFPVLTHYLPS